MLANNLDRVRSAFAAAVSRGLSGMTCGPLTENLAIAQLMARASSAAQMGEPVAFAPERRCAVVSDLLALHCGLMDGCRPDFIELVLWTLPQGAGVLTCTAP